jgi:uncharacterized protein YceK
MEGKMDNFFEKVINVMKNRVTKLSCLEMYKTKTIFSVFVMVLMLAGCGSIRTPNESVENKTVSDPQNNSKTEHAQFSGETNTFKDIPIEVIGIPYEYKDICGTRAIDNLIEKSYESGINSQQAAFLNFTIDKFVFNFMEDGSLNLHRVYSYDKTPVDDGKFYPAQSGKIHDWKLEPKYHSHSGGDCSLDLYNDIATSQAKLNEMRSDPSLGKVYDILLSVAEDMDYNYPAIGRKAKFVTLPNGKEPLKGVCDDYSNLLIDRLTAANIKGISNIQKVTGQNHAWVTLVYKGSTLYLDATWFDKNIIDENGVVDHTPHKDPRNMTFDNDIFTNHNQHHIAGGTKNIGS